MSRGDMCRQNTGILLSVSRRDSHHTHHLYGAGTVVVVRNEEVSDCRLRDRDIEDGVRNGGARGESVKELIGCIVRNRHRKSVLV